MAGGALARLAEEDGGGLGRVARALDAAARAGRLGHAYLVFGPTGAGKRRLARALAADLLGAAPERVEGHPDLALLRPLDGKREIGIDAVREATAWLALAAFSGGEGAGRVAIVEGADTLGEEAANAMLKTLEEPPAGATLILLTARPDAVLPTIRSRCLGLRVPPRAGAGASAAFAADGARLLLEERGDPFELAARCWALCERAGAEDEHGGGTPLERKRRAAFAVIDAAAALAAERFRAAARAGGPALREAAQVERIAGAAEHLEANATPALVLEVLALDLAEGRAGPRIPRRV